MRKTCRGRRQSQDRQKDELLFAFYFLLLDELDAGRWLGMLDWLMQS
jgi:hypothetical protein